MIVNIKSHSIVEMEIEIEDVYLFDEFLEFTLGLVPYGELVDKTAYKWALAGATFRSCLIQDTSGLSTDGQKLVSAIYNSNTFWAADKFVLLRGVM